MRRTWTKILGALAALGFLAGPGFAQADKQGKGEDAPQFKQIKLTEKQVQNFLAAQKDLAPLSKKLEAAGDKPDPQLEAQVEQIAKKNGFADLQEFDDVAANVQLVLSGLDPQTGSFTEPAELIRRDIEQINRETKMPEKEKATAVAEMQEALKNAPTLQFKENIPVVKKYQKQLGQAFEGPPKK